MFEKYLSNVNDIQCEEITVKNPNKNRTFTSEYLFTYVLPLFAFDINKIPDLLCLILYLLTIMFLVCKNLNLIGNIYLDLRGYSYYTCVGGKENSFIIISNSNLKYFENSTIDIKWVNNNTAIHIVSDCGKANK